VDDDGLFCFSNVTIKSVSISNIFGNKPFFCPDCVKPYSSCEYLESNYLNLLSLRFKISNENNS
jgi:hypothetical protein